MTTLVVFDIEAVPDLEVGRRLLGQPEGAPDVDVRRMLGERYARDGQDPTTTFLKTPLYRIVSIAALYAKREEGGGPWTVTQIGSRSVAEKGEAELLLGFVKSLPADSRGTGPILVTFGGNGFDLPLLRYRAFALGVPVPGLHNGGRRNYWHRYGQDHIDLCDVLSAYGASTKPSLAEMAALANIPVKIGGVDGSQVEAFVAAGRLAEVADYCLTDVLATFLNEWGHRHSRPTLALRLVKWGRQLSPARGRGYFVKLRRNLASSANMTCAIQSPSVDRDSPVSFSD